jgi:hypothetical protein
MESSPARKGIIEEALGNSVADSLRGAELGASIVSALDDFLFRDIESDAQALDLFAFIDDEKFEASWQSAFEVHDGIKKWV